MADEFYNFDEALDQLNLKEEELKRLVSEGEIRAFREGNTMKLRRLDVETLKNELMGGDVVDLGSSGEELVFEDDLSLENAGMATEEIAMATEEIGDAGALGSEDALDLGVEEIEPLDDDEELEPAGGPVVRRGTGAAEEASEGMGMRLVAILNALLLVLAIPVLVCLSSGNYTDFARSIVGLFVGKE